MTPEKPEVPACPREATSVQIVGSILEPGALMVFYTPTEYIVYFWVLQVATVRGRSGKGLSDRKHFQFVKAGATHSADRTADPDGAAYLSRASTGVSS
jgi:hypothetical protein